MTEFIQGSEYIFVGDKSMIHRDANPDNIDNILKLGKFIKYENVRMWSDILPNAKAIFENGTIDSGQYMNVKLYVDYMDTFKSTAIHNLESLDR